MSESLEAEIKDLRRRLHDLSNSIQVEREARRELTADLVGTSGNNGKIGALRGHLGLMRTILVAVGLAALGGLGTGIAAVYSAGERRGSERARLETLERQTMDHATQLQSLAIWSEVVRLRFFKPGEGQ